MNLDKLKLCMDLGKSFEVAYGLCILELTEKENQQPSKKLLNAREHNATMGSVRNIVGSPEMTDKIRKINLMLTKKISQKDIAEILGISQNTVSKTKSRYNLPI